jgi:hypothetical protein
MGSGNDELPPMPGKEKAIKQIQPPMDAIPLYVQGMAIPLTEQEALGVIAQLSSALQTRTAGMSRAGEVVRNG